MVRTAQFILFIIITNGMEFILARFLIVANRQFQVTLTPTNETIPSKLFPDNYMLVHSLNNPINHIGQEKAH